MDDVAVGEVPLVIARPPGTYRVVRTSTRGPETMQVTLPPGGEAWLFNGPALEVDQPAVARCRAARLAAQQLLDQGEGPWKQPQLVLDGLRDCRLALSASPAAPLPRPLPRFCGTALDPDLTPYQQTGLLKADPELATALGLLLLLVDERLEAVLWLEAAAWAGDADAASALGMVLLQDRRSEAQITASYWLWRSAAGGSAVGARNYATALLKGSGIAPDPGAGERLLQCQAAAGDVASMRTLGLAYQHGIGVARQPRLAQDWLSRAAQAGDAAAAAALTSPSR